MYASDTKTPGGGLVSWLVSRFILCDGWGEGTVGVFWLVACADWGGVRWFCGGSDIARFRPEESDGGGVSYPFEEVDVLSSFLGIDRVCSNMACFVVAVDETVALGEPTGAHPSVVSPFGSVLG